MKTYESVQGYINRAQVQRSIYIAELLSSSFFATRDALKRATADLLALARTKTRNSVFTFDA